MNAGSGQVKGVANAGEAGWHISRYNLSATNPETGRTIIANLYRGSCFEYTSLELCLLEELETLPADHPLIEVFAKRGIIVDFDEQAALETRGRIDCAYPRIVSMTICPTMACNFACPYCFEERGGQPMSSDVQDDVVALAGRMLDASHARMLFISWYGGEPLLAPDVIHALSERLMATADERGVEYRAAVVTNGYLLTAENVSLLESVCVRHAQVTLDGLGPIHDATRHLAGGEGSFETIITNLGSQHLPFTVTLRHNVHEGNLAQVDEVERFVEELAERSGNALIFQPVPVMDNATATRRGSEVELLSPPHACQVKIRQEAGRFIGARSRRCGASSLWSVGVDSCGGLHKCWEMIDKESDRFGVAHDWDPKDPLGTAAKPQNLMNFVNSAGPVTDPECRECVWLPHCAGGCPNDRVNRERRCWAFKDDPESFVLALYARQHHGQPTPPPDHC